MQKPTGTQNIPPRWRDVRCAEIDINIYLRKDSKEACWDYFDKIFSLKDGLIVLILWYPKNNEEFWRHYIPMYTTGVKGFDFVADLKFLYFMYREWFGRFAM